MGIPAASPPKALWGRSFFLVLAALILSLAMAFYVNRILIPYQKAYAAAHELPRGNPFRLVPPLARSARTLAAWPKPVCPGRNPRDSDWILRSAPRPPPPQ